MRDAPTVFSQLRLTAGNAALQTSLFTAAVGCLEEGSPNARACGKRMLLVLRDNIMEATAFQSLADKLHKKGQHLKVQEVIGISPDIMLNDVFADAKAWFLLVFSSHIS